ncbi:MAG: hypothetical protein AB1726_10550 [Planctomycetota bacterium]
MSALKEAIEQGLDLLQELLGNEPALAEEFARTRGWFAGRAREAGDAARRADELAARRHREWFLLERPSEHLGGVPVVALREAWVAAAGGPLAAHAGALLGSRASAFAVTAVDRFQGVWLRDLFGAGEHAVEEPEAAPELEEGDLVVGRLFPSAEGVCRLSPASACFRDPRLLAAVERDAARMHGARRGVMRIGQLELERLFFGGAAGGPEAASPGDPAVRARDLLRGAGLSSARTEGILARLAEGARRGDGTVVGAVLDELAFASEADLGALRLAFVALWNGTAGTAAPGNAPGPPVAGAAEERVRAALARFDAGRAAGEDLEGLFRTLEHALGCAEGDVEVEGEEIPDFPGAVGALIEEFLWEEEHARGRAVPAGHRRLRLLGEYGQRIGVVENLSPRDLLDFAGRWVLDRRRLESPAAAGELVAALADFSRWCDAEHALVLGAGFASLAAELAADLPRLVTLRARLPARPPGRLAPFEVAFVGEAEVVLRDPEGSERTAVLDPPLLVLLRPGDRLRARLEPPPPILGAVYPAVLGRLAPPRRRS